MHLVDALLDGMIYEILAKKEPLLLSINSPEFEKMMCSTAPPAKNDNNCRFRDLWYVGHISPSRRPRLVDHVGILRITLTPLH